MIIPELILPATMSLKAHSVACESGTFEIFVSSDQRCSQCPLCHCICLRKHSKYTRKLMDLPISGNIVRIHLTVCRFFCDNVECHRKIFTEQFPHEVKPYARRLLRSDDLLGRVALELGGNTGATISRFIKIPVSASTILRIIKKKTIASIAVTSGIIGVDDWALKKGHVYGTILVDLESHKVIDLLEDREADTLALWLEKHPEVKVISRDRASNYSRGAKKGAPKAIQVADRFHLIKNLGETVTKVFQRRGKILNEAYDQYNTEAQAELPAEEQPVIEHQEQPENELINPARLHKFENVKEQHRSGHNVSAISRALKIDRRTVSRYIELEKVTKDVRRVSNKLKGFEEYIFQEMTTGKNLKTLYEGVVANGFRGSYDKFRYNLKLLLKKEKITRQLVPTRNWSPKELSIMLYKDEKDLEVEDKKFLTLLYERCPAIKQTGGLVRQFKDLFKTKEQGSLAAWIDSALKVDTEIKTFAKNLNKDFDAVNNAVVTQYSNGQVEGQVNKLKNIKRRMYGKASFQLLRNMVLADTG